MCGSAQTKNQSVAAGDQIYSTTESNSLQDELRQKSYRSKIPLLLSKGATTLRTGESWVRKDDPEIETEHA